MGNESSDGSNTLQEVAKATKDQMEGNDKYLKAAFDRNLNLLTNLKGQVQSKTSESLTSEIHFVIKALELLNCIMQRRSDKLLDLLIISLEKN